MLFGVIFSNLFIFFRCLVFPLGHSFATIIFKYGHFHSRWGNRQRLVFHRSNARQPIYPLQTGKLLYTSKKYVASKPFQEKNSNAICCKILTRKNWKKFKSVCSFRDPSFSVEILQMASELFRIDLVSDLIIKKWPTPFFPSLSSKT